MAICTACLQLINQFFTNLRQIKEPWMGKFKHFPHTFPFGQLQISAKTCPLCSLIWEALFEHPDSRPFEDYDERQIISVRCFSSLAGGTLNSYIHALDISGHVSRSPGHLRIYASPGSPAAEAGEICGRMPLDDSGSADAISLIRSWVQDCLENHSDCTTTLAGDKIDEAEEAPLPTRVIDVGAHDAFDGIRLVETKGLRGHYIALSHCWGTSNLAAKSPLRTTAETLKDHCNRIALESLPKPFRDAVTVTRALEIRYLWIDSLCILQDSQEDWLCQSKIMGQIYERARLTISASGAQNSGDGLFLTRKAYPAVEVPYLTKSGQQLGSFYISRAPSETPSDCALEKRAWITQEWLLSRRMIHYNRDNITWSCKHWGGIGLNETGDIHVTNADKAWFSGIVRNYSARSLTRETDKLVALEGLITEMKKIREDNCYQGQWEGDFPDNLFWTLSPRKEFRGTLNFIPSWSWASVVGNVFAKELRYSCTIAYDSLHVDDGSILVADGLVKPGRITPTPGVALPPLARLIGSLISDVLSLDLPQGIIDDKGVFIGYAEVNDVAFHCADIFCLVLVQGKHYKRPSIWNPKTWRPKKTSYGVLILKRLPGEGEKYVRIGIGCLESLEGAVRKPISIV